MLFKRPMSDGEQLNLLGSTVRCDVRISPEKTMLETSNLPQKIEKFSSAMMPRRNQQDYRTNFRISYRLCNGKYDLFYEEINLVQIKNIDLYFEIQVVKKKRKY